MAEKTSSIPVDAQHPHSHLSQKPLYRISTLFRARPDLTEDQFYNHWYNIHGPLCVPWALHHNFVEYNQFHTGSELRQALMSRNEGGFKSASPFEACADFCVANYQDYLDAFEDPYYREVINIDENNFVDKSQRPVSSNSASTNVTAINTMGVNRSIIRNGKPVVEVPAHVYEKWNKFQSKKPSSKQ